MFEGNPEEELAAEIERLVARFPDDLLQQTAKAGGLLKQDDEQ